MNEDMSDDEVLSETHSSASSRRNSSICSQMANPHTRSRRGSTIVRQSSSVDANENKQFKPQSSVKVLVVNGKCSDIFKSTLEECVEDCILEFPGQTSIYVPKAGQSTINKPIPIDNAHSSARSQRRRSSGTLFNLPQVPGMRTNQTNNLSLPTAALTATTASRMRHQLNSQKFTFVDDISEEATDHQTTIEQIQNAAATELDSENPHSTFQEETKSRQSNFDASSQWLSPLRRKLPSAPAHLSNRDRQKDYLLSDLVMLGPEYFADVFNLPRPSRYAAPTPSRQRSSTQQRRAKTAKHMTELDRIKQDLFHRYLWTQKPNVSCRIRPISSYSRSTTYIT